MQTVLFVSGICLLIGGLGFAWTAATFRRRGQEWLGPALAAGATLLYSGVVLSGNFNPPTALSAGLIAVVAILMWAGAIIALREWKRRETDTTTTPSAGAGGESSSRMS